MWWVIGHGGLCEAPQGCLVTTLTRMALGWALSGWRARPSACAGRKASTSYSWHRTATPAMLSWILFCTLEKLAVTTAGKNLVVIIVEKNLVVIIVEKISSLLSRKKSRRCYRGKLSWKKISSLISWKKSRCLLPWKKSRRYYRGKNRGKSLVVTTVD